MKLVPFIVALMASSAGAQPGAQPRVQVGLEAIEGQGAYRLMLSLRSSEDQEVVRDRRLLRLSVRAEGSRRRLRCSHPMAPRKAAETRVAAMHAGEVYQEWIDLRMYCTGRALRALEGAAELEITYGFTSRSRRRWVARRTDERRPPHRVQGSHSWTGAAQSEAETTQAIVVRASAGTARSSWPSVRVRASGSGRVYLRDDLWSFAVRGPLGAAQCVPQRQRIVPIVDFFVRLNRRGRRSTLDTRLYCPNDTFRLEGVYEITPRLELVYDADAYDFDAITGTFEGAPVALRVLHRGAPYVEQRPEDLGGRP